MVESSRPTVAAVVAAPRRKLWPAYFVWSPTAAKASRILSTKQDLVSRTVFRCLKRGPGESQRIAMYTSNRTQIIVGTAQIDLSPNAQLISFGSTQVDLYD